MGWKCLDCRNSGPEINAIGCPNCGHNHPSPTDNDGFTAQDWLGQGTEFGDANYQKARKVIRFIRVTAFSSKVYRGDYPIGMVIHPNPYDYPDDRQFTITLQHEPNRFHANSWNTVTQVIDNIIESSPNHS